MAKDDYDKLLEIAKRLKRSEPPFFRKHDIRGLQAFVRDAGRCQYCSSEYYLYENYVTLGDSVADHLLPISEYACFEHDSANLVACCAMCNKMKGCWDPATEAEGEPELVIKNHDQLEAHRHELIKRTRKHIRENPDSCRVMFERAKPNFEAAVTEYHSSVRKSNVA